jgi:thioredoxin reductase
VLPSVHRRAEFRASKIVIDRARANNKIKWRIGAAGSGAAAAIDAERWRAENAPV